MNKSPCQVLYNWPHVDSFIKIFGYACFSNLKPYDRHKLDFSIKKCVFLKYNSSRKGYKYLNKSRGIYIARYVILNENDFSFLGDVFQELQNHIWLTLKF